MVYVDLSAKPELIAARDAQAHCRALQMLRNKQLENPWKKHDNIPLYTWGNELTRRASAFEPKRGSVALPPETR